MVRGKNVVAPAKRAETSKPVKPQKPKRKQPQSDVEESEVSSASEDDDDEEEEEESEAESEPEPEEEAVVVRQKKPKRPIAELLKEPKRARSKKPKVEHGVAFKKALMRRRREDRGDARIVLGAYSDAKRPNPIKTASVRAVCKSIVKNMDGARATISKSAVHMVRAVLSRYATHTVLPEALRLMLLSKKHATVEAQEDARLACAVNERFVQGAIESPHAPRWFAAYNDLAMEDADARAERAKTVRTQANHMLLLEATIEVLEKAEKEQGELSEADRVKLLNTKNELHKLQLEASVRAVKRLEGYVESAEKKLEALGDRDDDIAKAIRKAEDNVKASRDEIEVATSVLEKTLEKQNAMADAELNLEDEEYKTPELEKEAQKEKKKERREMRMAVRRARTGLERAKAKLSARQKQLKLKQSKVGTTPALIDAAKERLVEHRKKLKAEQTRCAALRKDVDRGKRLLRSEEKEMDVDA